MIWMPILTLYFILGFFTLVIDIKIEGLEAWGKYSDGDAVFIAFCCICFWPVVLFIYSLYLLYRWAEPILRAIAHAVMDFAIKLSGVNKEKE